MKKNIHPNYQKVLFVDSASGHKIVIGTTLKPEAKEVFEGVEYPVYYLSTSSSSHPFFTKEKRFADAAGRIDKFNKRFSTPEKVAARQAEMDALEAARPAAPAHVAAPKAAKAPAPAAKPATKAPAAKAQAKPAAKEAAKPAKAPAPKKK